MIDNENKCPICYSNINESKSEIIQHLKCRYSIHTECIKLYSKCIYCKKNLAEYKSSYNIGTDSDTDSSNDLTPDEIHIIKLMELVSNILSFFEYLIFGSTNQLFNNQPFDNQASNNQASNTDYMIIIIYCIKSVFFT